MSKIDTQIDLHLQCITTLRMIQAIQRKLAYAQRRAIADAKVSVLSGLVPGWKAQIVHLTKAYEIRCSQYASLQLALNDQVREEIAACLTVPDPSQFRNPAVA